MTNMFGGVERPGPWETTGDHERRIRALEALENCCDDDDCASYADAVAAIGDLIAYWRMGAPSGNQPDTAENPSGPMDLEWQSGTTPGTYDVPGALSSGDDGAFSFNFNQSTDSADPSDGDYFLADDSPTPRWPSLTDPMSVVFFIRPRSGWDYPSPTGAAAHIVGTSENAGTPFPQGWGVGILPPGSGFGTGGPEPGQIIVCVRSSNSENQQMLTGVPSIASDVWTHVAFTYDGATMRLYLDGVLVASEASTFAVTTQTTIRVGGADWFTTPDFIFMFGDLDEVALYGKALTAGEIESLLCEPTCQTIDSTENVGDCWGVQSLNGTTPEEEGYVLTADGEGGSYWAYPTVAAGTTDGWVLTTEAGEAVWAPPEGGGNGGDGPGTELDYVEKTSNTTISATTEGSANTIVTANSIVVDGSTRIKIEFFAYATLPGSSASSNIRLVLYEDGGSIGQIAIAQGPSNAFPTYGVRIFTPASGTRTYSIRGFRNASDGSVFAGTGGSGNGLPAFIRITIA